MQKYKAVLFDLDGTLLDTVGDLKEAVNYAMRCYRYPERSLTEIRSFVGNGLRTLAEQCIPDGRRNPHFGTVFQIFSEYYLKHCIVETKPYEGIMELLAALQCRGYRMAIVSNKVQEAVTDLNQFFFKEYIQAAIGVRSGLARKPAPDMAQLALEELGCRAEDVILMGDSEVDQRTAEKAGLDYTLVSWGFRSREALSYLNPKNMIDEPMQLLNLLEH